MYRGGIKSKKNILICSTHFSPAFIGHMKAWYKLCNECGFTASLYFDEKYAQYFDKEDYEYSTDISKIKKNDYQYVIVQNIGLENIELFNWCKKQGIFIFYILHEPYMGIAECIKDGKYMPKQIIASIVNKWLCKKADKIIICSRYARRNCEKYMRTIVNKLIRIPLLFLDDYYSDNHIEREYFSLIGTFSSSHGSDDYIEFIKEAYKRGCQMKYQIVTRSDISDKLSDSILKKMIKDGVLVIKHGNPLSEKEINYAYRRSFAVWNGYRRTTQSGVLPNSFMQGTPVIATRLKGFKEFINPGKNGIYINSTKFEEIYRALIGIKRNEKKINLYCRKYFLENFYYISQINRLNKLFKYISKIKG